MQSKEIGTSSHVPLLFEKNIFCTEPPASSIVFGAFAKIPLKLWGYCAAISMRTFICCRHRRFSARRSCFKS